MSKLLYVIDLWWKPDVELLGHEMEFSVRQTLLSY